jgi:hypothetical protein
MFTETFRATTKYGDFTGTSQVDVADKTGPRAFLKEKGLIKEGEEFLLGIEVGTGEMHGKYSDPVTVTFLLAQKGDHDTIKTMIDATNGPIMVRKITQDMAIVDFMAMFKRFSVAFSTHAMLEGREVTYLDY